MTTDPSLVNDALVEAETRMKETVRALEVDLSGFRTGRASPVLIERLPVEYYGTPTPLVQLATIGVPGPAPADHPSLRPGQPEGHRTRHPGAPISADPQQRRQDDPPEHPAPHRGTAA